MKTDKIAKVADILETAASSGKLPRQLKTQAEFYTACECVKVIAKNGSATFIQSALKDFFTKHGFKVQEEGIGWRVAA